MALKTIPELSKETGIALSTFHQAIKAYGQVKRGKADAGPLRDAARQSGAAWLIDTEHPAYIGWLAARDEQPRVKGEKKKQLMKEQKEQG